MVDDYIADKSYIVVMDDCIEELARRVNIYVDCGYVPTGGIVSIIGGSYKQAMIKKVLI